MNRLLISFIAFLGLTIAANAQCATGYTQLSNVFACQLVGFNVGYTTTPTASAETPALTYVLANGPYTMPQAGAIQSVSVYLTGAVTGILGVYDATGSGGKPGALIATTASTSLVAGWNTVATTTHPSLTSGEVFWPVVLGTAGTSVPLERDYVSGTYYYDTSGNSVLPSSYGTATVGNTGEAWGLYATFQ